MIVVVMVDALCPTYLTLGSPFLSRVLEGGLSAELIPPFGFEPDAAYVAGLDPEESDGGFQYWRSPETSPFRWVKPLVPLLRRAPRQAQRAARLGIRGVNRLAMRDGPRRYLARPAEIPFESLALFDLPHHRFMYEPGYTRSSTVFDHLRGAGRKWGYFGYPRFRGSFERILESLNPTVIAELDFVFVMVADLDFAGHRYGPEAPETREVVLRVDRCLQRLYEMCVGQDKQATLVIFGDHGMVPVRRHVDVLETLRSVGLYPRPEFDLFLDSTFARFWFHDGAVGAEVEAVLGALEGGRHVDREEQAEYRARYQHRKFGDYIWWADGGTVILPNFYQGGRPVMGMHGYRREVVENHSELLVYGASIGPSTRVDHPASTKRIYPTLLKLAGLASGEECARSLL